MVSILVVCYISEPKTYIYKKFKYDNDNLISTHQPMTKDILQFGSRIRPKSIIHTENGIEWTEQVDASR